MREKMKLHIIAVTAFVLFVVLGLACATAPKPPVEMVYDSSIPEEQTASIFIPAGSVEVIGFNGITLSQKWYQPSLLSPGLLVKIPAGQSQILFHYYGGGGADAMNIRLNFTAIAGRVYYLYNFESNPGSRYSQVSSIVYEIMYSSLSGIPLKEPGPNEQKLYIQVLKGAPLFIINAGTDDERRIMANADPDAYVIVAKGEHTLDIGLSAYYIQQYGSDISPAAEPQRNFTASSVPVRYTVEVTSSGLGRNTKFLYTLIQK